MSATLLGKCDYTRAVPYFIWPGPSRSHCPFYRPHGPCRFRGQPMSSLFHKWACHTYVLMPFICTVFKWIIVKSQYHSSVPHSNLLDRVWPFIRNPEYYKMDPFLIIVYFPFSWTRPESGANPSQNAAHSRQIPRPSIPVQFQVEVNMDSSRSWVRIRTRSLKLQPWIMSSLHMHMHWLAHLY